MNFHDLRKAPIAAKKALALAKGVKHVYGYMGSKESYIDMKRDKPGDKDLSKLIIGRSNTLRAPCLQVGDTFVGGFNEKKYKTLLKL